MLFTIVKVGNNCVKPKSMLHIQNRKFKLQRKHKKIMKLLFIYLFFFFSLQVRDENENHTVYKYTK